MILGRKSRSEMIGVFLALLELIREKKILVQQSDILGEIEIVEAPEKHKRTYAHASLHLADETPEERRADPIRHRSIKPKQIRHQQKD